MLEAGCTLENARPAEAERPRECAEAAVFARFVCRVAGLPAGTLEEQRAAGTAAGLDRAALLEAALEAGRETLTEGLHAAIGGLGERELRGRLLQLRRDVHNRRAIDGGRLAAARPALPPDLYRGLDRHRRLAERRRRLLDRLAVTYETEVAAGRRRLQAAVGDADFQKGLLLASRDLYAGLARYRRARVERLGAKERQLERGLLRYLSRMAMKTSPFGTFTAIAPGRFAAGGADPAFRGDPRRKRGVVRLNKRIFAVVRDELLGDPEIRPHLPVELNPTLHPEGGVWRFLAGAGDHELFQRVPRGPVLDLFQRLLAGRSMPLCELERRLASSAEVEATAEQGAAYIARLLEIGFLRFRLGIGEQEADWDLPLGRLLAAVPGEAAARTRRLLERLRSGRDELEDAGVERRLTLFDETTRVMRETFPRLFERASLRTDVPYYEDAACAAALELPRDPLDAAAAELGDWVRLTSRLTWPRHDQASMRRFFDDYYGGGPVPLLRFYEDYYREHLKEHLERMMPKRTAETADGEPPEVEAEDAAPPPDLINPFGLEMIERIKAAGTGLEELIRERWAGDPDAEELTLTRADLEAAVAAVPEPAARCHSASVFVQLLPGLGAGGGTALLMSNLLQGFGKYFSRFLHVLPPELHADLVANNDRLTDELVAEISADGAYNANLHPPLLRWGVRYPTGEAGAEQGQLLVADLEVAPAPDDPHALCLRHRPSGRSVVALDLGFLNPRMRPPLFQLLLNFAPAPNYTLPVPELPFRPPPEGESPDRPRRIVHRPRLRFGGHLVLGRRRWTVPSELFPRRDGGEGDFEHFLRVDRWRHGHGIPREVFLSLYPHHAAAGPPPAGEQRPAASRRREHHHKPQYIDFANPLLVDLFSRSVEGLERFTAQLYERLPDREHLLAAAGERWVTELVLQVDLRRPPGASAPRGEGNADAD